MRWKSVGPAGVGRDLGTAGGRRGRSVGPAGIGRDLGTGGGRRLRSVGPEVLVLTSELEVVECRECGVDVIQ